jgi:hypothetical protein
MLVISAFAGCKNVFHGMQQQYPVNLPLLPLIEYTYPNQSSGLMDINRSVFIEFNKEMDPATVTESAFQVTCDPDPTPLDIYFEYTDEKIVVIKLKPADTLFTADSTYTVEQVGDLADVDGINLPAGYNWSFTTSSQEDVTDPRADDVYPQPGSLCTVKRPAITVKLSEDVIPRNLSDCFTLHKNGAADLVPGTVEYHVNVIDENVVERVAVFTPTVDLGNNSRYDVSISGLKDLAGRVMVPCEWSFLTGAIKKDFENPDIRNYYHGFGTFGYKSSMIGYLLRTESGFPLVGSYNYGDSLTLLFDPEASGPLGAGKYIRITHRGASIIDQVPIAKAAIIDGPAVGAPGKNQLYVDHVLGRFILPRPNYWNMFEKAADIENPVIQDELPSGSVFNFPDDGKWGSCAQVYSTFSMPAAWELDPFGASTTVNSGTISYWTKMETNWSADGMTTQIHFGGSGNYVQLSGSTVAVYINGTNVIYANKSFVSPTPVLWHNVYILWDLGKSLSANTYRLRVFIDGEDQFPDNKKLGADWIPGRFYVSFWTGASAYIYYSIRFDNMKIWKHVVSEDPQWEYKNRTGRQNALHAVYGADDVEEYDYRPKLTAPDGGVGYYYLP